MAAQADMIKELETGIAQSKGKLQLLEGQHNATKAATTKAAEEPPWSTANAMTVSSCVLLFGLFSLIIAAILMKRTQVTTDGILKIFGMIMLIFSAIFLVVAGYTQEQIGPVLGLLGTIAGFIFGRSQSRPANAEPAEAADKKKAESQAS
jgi:hypothetical protein